ncbi:4007_t:CDS:1, partial [Rhizophagus irregularis]
KFALENFDEFFDIYKEKNSLASEALLALSCFLTALNDFFDLDDDLNEELITNNTIISWYSYTNMTASEDCIRAVSKYYNESEF